MTDTAQAKSPHSVGSAIPSASVGPTDKREGSYIDWSCALAGAVIAGAVLFGLMTFGSAIGLSIISPSPRSATSGFLMVLFATAWTIFGHLTAFGIGGYLAGRMRRPWHDASPSEVQFRDGAHGALVWAVAAVLGALILSTAAASVLRGGIQATAQGTTESSDAGTAVVDALFRTPEPTAQAVSSADARAEANRIVALSLARGELIPADRNYLARVVAARTSISQADAEARVSDVMNRAHAAAKQARAAGVMAAFLAGATLLLGLGAAWNGARIGGQHRDDGSVWRGFGAVPLSRKSARI